MSIGWIITLVASPNVTSSFLIQPHITSLSRAGAYKTSSQMMARRSNSGASKKRRDGGSINSGRGDNRKRYRNNDNDNRSDDNDFRESPQDNDRNNDFEDGNFDGYDDFEYDAGIKIESLPEVATTAVSSNFFSRKEITDPSFSTDTENFKKLCNGAGIVQPSRIQALAWPVLLQGQSSIVADQTGSGKTLAYLLPIIQRMLTSSNDSTNQSKQYGSPKILILAPTAELADQIKPVCDSLSASTSKSFSTKVITATGKYTTNIRDQIRMIDSSVIDVLITTPGRIATILRTKNSGNLDLTNVQSIVLDEVDILLIDKTFGPQLRTVGAAAAPSSLTQFVFVTATLPDSVVDSVTREFLNVQMIKGPGLHRVALTVKENLVDVSLPPVSNRDLVLGFDVKAKMLMKALRANRCKRTVVFCNTVESCRKVENLIRRSDRRGKLLEVGAYHNAMNPGTRNKNLGIFAHGLHSRDQQESTEESGYREKKQQYQTKEVNHILVCTDRAARGVDFEAAPVDHVILFDFPKDPAEYVRRVGRTARAGRAGTSTVFAYGWQLPIARKIMGGKLESFTVAADDNDDDDEYTTKQRQGKGKKRQKDSIIGGNIADGRLWD